MNRTELAQLIAEKERTSKLHADRLLRLVLDSIKDGLRRDGTVAISGFGTFTVKPAKGRIGRNPVTGEPIEIPAHYRVGFKAGKDLLDIPMWMGIGGVALIPTYAALGLIALFATNCSIIVERAEKAPVDVETEAAPAAA